MDFHRTSDGLILSVYDSLRLPRKKEKTKIQKNLENSCAVAVNVYHQSIMQFISSILDRIPQPAWIGLSISGVIATFGLTISTIMSNDVELKIANSKLVLSRQIAKAKELNSTSEQTLKVISETLQKSQQTNTELREKIKQLKSASCQVKNQQIQELEQTIEKVAEPETDKNIQEIEEIKSELLSNSESLEKLNEELVEEIK